MEHKNDKRHLIRLDYRMEVLATGLTIPKVKTVEQAVISLYTLQYIDNMGREIVVKNLLFRISEKFTSVVEVFTSVTEDEVMNLMGRQVK